MSNTCQKLAFTHDSNCCLKNGVKKKLDAKIGLCERALSLAKWIIQYITITQGLFQETACLRMFIKVNLSERCL